MIKHGKNTDIVKKAQNIIDNYVMAQTKQACTKMGKTDMFLWSAALAASLMTLTLYILSK